MDHQLTKGVQLEDQVHARGITTVSSNKNTGTGGDDKVRPLLWISDASGRASRAIIMSVWGDGISTGVAQTF
jgi:hypothetical protein